jgi:nucleotide-binding universal stress UspA family protein
MKTKSKGRTIVVGYDKSPDSERALAEAARIAATGDRTLTIVHAYRWMPPIAPIAVPTDRAEQAWREAAQQLVEDAAARMAAAHPDLKILTQAIEGHAVSKLVGASLGADLLVVGNRGHGGFAELFMGAVSMRVLASTFCPVLVIRGESRPTQDRVLAAVDPDGPCDEVLEFAFDAAAQRDAALTVLHVWDLSRALGHADPSETQDIAAIECDRAADLAAIVSRWQEKYPDVTVTQQVRTGSPATVLVRESATADLLVIGGRHYRELMGVVVGLVSTAALRHSACPVAVVPIEI